MTASGRKQTLDFVDFEDSERPLLRKADIGGLRDAESPRDVRFTPETGHWAKMGEIVR